MNTHQGICTCSSTSNRLITTSTRWSGIAPSGIAQSRRSIVSSARSRYPAAASTTAAATGTEKELPKLTDNDKKRLKQLRNVGISAHIDRYA